MTSAACVPMLWTPASNVSIILASYVSSALFLLPRNLVTCTSTTSTACNCMRLNSHINYSGLQLELSSNPQQPQPSTACRRPSKAIVMPRRPALNVVPTPLHQHPLLAPHWRARIFFFPVSLLSPRRTFFDSPQAGRGTGVPLPQSITSKKIDKSSSSAKPLDENPQSTVDEVPRRRLRSRTLRLGRGERPGFWRLEEP
jgi:hypothetical protein